MICQQPISGNAPLASDDDEDDLHAIVSRHHLYQHLYVAIRAFDNNVVTKTLRGLMFYGLITRALYKFLARLGIMPGKKNVFLILMAIGLYKGVRGVYLHLLDMLQDFGSMGSSISHNVINSY